MFRNRNASGRKQAGVCLLKTESIQRCRVGNLNWHLRPSFVTAELMKILEDPDALLAKGPRLFKNDHSATVGAAHGFVIKRSNPRKRRNLIFDLFRGSRGWRAFRRAFELECHGIPTAKAIATADRRLFGLPHTSYLIVEEIPVATHLGKWSADKLPTIENVAGLIAALHEAGFRHGDLKETNILFDSSGRPCLIDLDAVRFFPKKLPASAAANDLARLWGVKLRTKRCKNSDAVRFLKLYCKKRGLSDLRSWWKRILRARRKYS